MGARAVEPAKSRRGRLLAESFSIDKFFWPEVNAEKAFWQQSTWGNS